MTVESNTVEIEILPEIGDPRVFAGTTKIELAGEVLDRMKTVVLTDKEAIDALLKTIRLDDKGPCECEHRESAVFTTPKGEVRVSLCSHCFDFGHKHWKMPKAFYKVFQKHFARP